MKYRFAIVLGVLTPWLFAVAGVDDPATNAPPAAVAAADPWSGSVSVSGYLIPDGTDYANPTVMADHNWLHLEARYNYEALKTGSFWLGYNWSVGTNWVFEVTPMLGGVVGNLRGIAPGYELSLTRGGFAFSTEGEYVFATANRDENFFYSWSEFSYSPWDWFRAGVVIQRTRAYQSDLDTQRGLLVGFTYQRFDFTTYVFNFGWESPTVVLALTASF